MTPMFDHLMRANSGLEFFGLTGWRAIFWPAIIIGIVLLAILGFVLN